MKKVLFICTQNAGRSQMAEAFFNRMAMHKATALSAGSRPAASVHPVVIDVMNEMGIDLRNKKPRGLTQSVLDEADIVISMGCQETCPAEAQHNWHIDDPADKPLDEVRRIRDEIKRKVSELIEEIEI